MKILIRPLTSGWFLCEIQDPNFTTTSHHATELAAYMHVMDYDQPDVIQLADKKLKVLRQKAQEQLSSFTL